ncbi:type II toxin-antitoxin system HicB family antitoxin [Photorhabdus asymbiotica]|uniref:type II toxin-antitoxin system HicB family antitoxin n=1 Tax=Photorhabdus asymbiotica TaxID=291112 RepID=UPI003DA6DB4A
MLYPAFIEVDTDGSASGWFPNVPGCYFAGDTLEETWQDAKSAIEVHFELLTQNESELPKARTMQEHLAENIGKYIDGQWILVDVNMDKFDGRAERINITLPHRLLHRIDTIVHNHPEYGSRSGFLAQAARNELQKII